MLLILVLIFASLALAACALYLAWSTRGYSREQILLRCLLAVCLAVVVYLACPWYYSSVYLRFLLPACVAVGVARMFFFAAATVSGRKYRRPIGLYALAGISVFLVLLLIIDAYPPSGTADLRFPLRGRYCVMQGGGMATNPFHQADPSGRYAVDIVGLNSTGNRANGLCPADPDAYAIYGDTVFAPCNGVVQEAVGHLPDTEPGNPDVLHPPGNHLVIRVRSAVLLLAHLQQGSLLVSPGMTITAGQPLARVGNSGNTAEPHLHIHMEMIGDGYTEPEAIPLLFDGAYPLLNDIIVQ